MSNAGKFYSYFESGLWEDEINVRDFIVKNYTPYDGDSSFLVSPTKKTIKLWEKVCDLMKIERQRGGVYDVSTDIISTITSHKPGYIDKDLESIVGVQTDEPLKRSIMPFGGYRMVLSSLDAYGKKEDPNVANVFKYRKTHNDGVFDAYTDEMLLARKAAIITGLPDAYGRGRIIGDYRRVPLYGVDKLIEEKIKAKKKMVPDVMDSDTIRAREEISEQIRSLNELKVMAKSYGFDISQPATDVKEAIQWLYFAYLAATKEQNGAAMSIGRISTFLDIYAQRDLESGKYSEEEIQEMVDHFVMKLRMIRFLRTPEYDELFSGDPTWVTECIGGMCLDGRHLVTKMSFRFLHTLRNLGPAPEPNMTILWNHRLPNNFKEFCAEISIQTSSIQYESDEIMLEEFGDDYGIACCVSPMRLGKQMQFFGARCNLAKALLYAINEGKDEKLGLQVGPNIAPTQGEYLDYDEVRSKLDIIFDWLARLYINTLNVIHYMHDKYCYERIQMALHDENITRTMAGGIAGLSVIADSLSAIKYAKVKPIRNKDGLIVDFDIEGDYPKYGNNDDRVDEIAVDIVKIFSQRLALHDTYRDSISTMSVLTITSNVVYGKKTGTTPDGRKAGEPFAPGANPMHGRDSSGCVASFCSVAKIPFKYSQDGISNTFSIIPSAIGSDDKSQRQNLVQLMDGYFSDGGYHLNVNVLQKDVLKDAMIYPEKYPQLTIRVSGYAVNFIKLTREQQEDVISRTFHQRM
ncbi:formate C-acetyltransferase [Helicobacter sp. MIT 99-5507]|uniref:formate C-acetyltransferase n=1 Tax=Helicobacter sp. MIT 99-5507 TaxID=152489 RepID=UPI000E1E64E0|nr:formate C-acetyltransferase [Helicobacter sp. MIT 99-5507]RDU57434.1 formate acetyltransferase [Helicobacter sp. MIT 99-5507]